MENTDYKFSIDDLLVKRKYDPTYTPNKENIVFKNNNAIVLWFGAEYLVEFKDGDYKWFSDYEDAILFANSNDRG